MIVLVTYYYIVQQINNCRGIAQYLYALRRYIITTIIIITITLIITILEQLYFMFGICKANSFNGQLYMAGQIPLDPATMTLKTLEDF